MDLNITIEPECISKFIQNFPKNSKYIEQYNYKTSDIYIYSPLFEVFSKTGLLDQYHIVINIDYNTSGLRSNAWKEVFNIDVEKNKKITLSDLFSSSAYRSQIVAEVNKQAKEKSIKLIEPEGIKTIPEDQKFYIKDHKLVIYFENSAISKSELEFVMPFEFNSTLNKFSI